MRQRLSRSRSTKVDPALLALRENLALLVPPLLFLVLRVNEDQPDETAQTVRIPPCLALVVYPAQTQQFPVLVGLPVKTARTAQTALFPARKGRGDQKGHAAPLALTQLFPVLKVSAAQLVPHLPCLVPRVSEDYRGYPAQRLQCRVLLALLQSSNDAGRECLTVS